MIRSWIAVAILIGAVGACGPFCGNGKLNFSNSKLNPTSFTCPSGSQDYQYSINGSVDADNQTSKTITIKTVGTTATIVKLAGDNWSAKVGDTSGADDIDFKPKSISSGSKVTLKFTTPWDCTDSGGNTVETYADFKLQLVMVTSSGTYKVDLPNHRMKMA
jgi:hypothetical protein